MYDYFHAHLVGINLKTQESNMFGKLKELFPFIKTGETFMLYKDSKTRSVISAKDKDSSKN